MKNWTTQLAVSGLMVLAASMASAQQMDTVIPESAVFAVWTESYPEFSNAIETSPYGKMLADPALESLKGWFGDQVQSVVDSGEVEGADKLTQLLDRFEGSIAFYVVENTEDAGFKDLGGVFIAEMNEENQAWVTENLDPLAGATDIQKSTYEVGGVTVYRSTGTRLEDDNDVEIPGLEVDEADSIFDRELTYHRATVGNFYLAAETSNDEVVKAAITALQGTKTASSVGDALTRLPAITGNPESRLSFYSNLEQVLEVALAEITMDSEPEEAATAQRVFDALGVRDLKRMVYWINPSEDAVSDEWLLEIPAERSGLLDAYLQGEFLTLDTLKYAPADSISVTAFTLEMGPIYDAVMKVAEAVSPQAPMLANMYLLGIQSEYEVDIANSLVKNIGREHLFVSRPLDEASARSMEEQGLPAAPAQSAYLGFRNQDVVYNTLNTLLEKLKANPEFGSSIKTTTDSGVTVLEIDMPALSALPVVPGIAFSKEGVAYASNQVELQESIRALKGQSTAPITATAGYQEVLTKVPTANLRSFAYSPAEGLGYAMEQSYTALEMFLSGSDMDGLTIDMLPTPDVITKYFGSTYLTLVEGENFLHAQRVVEAKK